MAVRLVSIVMPANRVGQYLDETLASVRAQTWVHWELIVVDDGSPDPDGLAAHVSVDERMRVVRHAHSGIAASRNLGLAHSKGELVAFLDDDDLWEANHLEVNVAALERDPAAVAAYSGVILIDNEGRLLARPENARAGRPDVLSGRVRLSLQSVLVRRDVLRQIGGFDVRYRVADDADLLYRVADAGPLAWSPEFTARYRRHADNNTSRVKPSAIDGDRVIGQLLLEAAARGDRETVRLLRRNRRRFRRNYAAASLQEARRMVGRRDFVGGMGLVAWSASFSPSGVLKGLTLWAKSTLRH